MKHTLFFVSMVILFSGCKKIKDFLDNGPGQPPPSTTCRVDTIYPVQVADPVMDRSTSVGVHYNDKGLPILANYTIVHYGTYQFPVHYKYDGKNRLIEIRPDVTDELPGYLYSAPRYIKYVYEGDSPLPVRDTIFTWEAETVGEVEDLFYDANGRVSRVVHRHAQHPWPAEYEIKYYYDAMGNRQVSQAADGTTPGLIEYSDKPSLYSLSPVWKLVYKDYSKNSVKMGIETYTAQGLPLKGDLVSNNEDQSYSNWPFLNVESFGGNYFSYLCSGSAN